MVNHSFAVVVGDLAIRQHILVLIPGGDVEHWLPPRPVSSSNQPGPGLLEVGDEVLHLFSILNEALEVLVGVYIVHDNAVEMSFTLCGGTKASPYNILTR